MIWWLVGIYAVGALIYGRLVLEQLVVAHNCGFTTVVSPLAVLIIYSLLWPVLLPCVIVNWLADRAASNEPKP